MEERQKTTSELPPAGTFPNQLDHFIRHLGLQKSQLAKALGVSSTTLSLYIAGRRAVPDDRRVKCAELLHCRVEDLFPPPTFSFESGSYSHDNITTGYDPLRSPSFPVISRDVQEEDSKERNDAMRKQPRRLFLQQGINTARAAFLGSLSPQFADMELAERLTQALKKTSSIDEIFLQHLEATTRQNRKRFVLAKNSSEDIRSLSHDVSVHLTTLTSLLERPLFMRQPLCALAGETAQLLGDICFFERNADTANRYYDVAMEAAQEAQNEVLQAVIVGRRSFVPLYAGDTRLAFSLIQHALQLASHEASNEIRAWLSVVEAEAQAALGNEQACETALQHAEQWLDQHQDGISTCTFPTEPSYAPLNRQRLRGYKGACYLRLRLPQKAQPILRDSFASMNTTSLHRQSITLIDLAQTYALQGEVEAMTTYAAQALQALEQTRSPSVLQRFLALRQEVAPWQETTSLKQLDQHLVCIFPSLLPSGREHA